MMQTKGQIKLRLTPVATIVELVKLTLSCDTIFRKPDFTYSGYR